MSRKLKNPKNFIIYCRDGDPQRYSDLAEELKCSVVDVGGICGKYTNQGVLSVGGNPSGVKQYMSACILYAKFFGKTDLLSFIPLFNENGGRTSDFYKQAEFNDGGNVDKCSVDETRAKEIQIFVTEHYEDGVLAIS